MNKEIFENFLKEYPDNRFCLHNGFPGYTFGIVKNPKWINNEKALKILTRYEKLTGEDPISEFDKLWHCNALEFKNKAWLLRLLTFNRIIGFIKEDECIYGNALDDL